MIRTFNNLINNAIQAIPEDKEGKIRIRIKKEENLFLVEIEDNGTGISHDKKPNIFVPYFTTKTAGTGLGLAMVKQIVENHNGSIYFTTQEGKGTIFTIELPCIA
jgi:two-component system nitrogen regulation sensor histidine kinase NtrY